MTTLDLREVTAVAEFIASWHRGEHGGACSRLDGANGNPAVSGAAG